MAIILDGSAGITTPGELVIADKIVHSGDTDTTIRFSADNTISMVTNGSEKMRIGASVINFPVDTGNRTIEIGSGRSGDGAAVIDLIGDTTYTDYGFRFSREGGGANAPSRLNHRGTGAFELITQEAADLRIYTTNTERMRIDASGNLLFNSGYGSVATAYGCRAWVNFNGTGTVAIRGSGNVTSITDNGVGNYIVNFTTAMPDTLYSTVVTGDGPVNAAHCIPFVACGSINATYSTTQVAVAFFITTNSATRADPTIVSLAVFR